MVTCGRRSRGAGNGKRSAASVPQSRDYSESFRPPRRAGAEQAAREGRSAGSLLRAKAAMAVVRDQSPRGRIGAIAKKMIGIIATAAAAAMVTMFTDKARVESASRDDKANVPARSRTPTAEASVMINPITLLRRRRRNSDSSFWSDISILNSLVA